MIPDANGEKIMRYPKLAGACALLSVFVATPAFADVPWDFQKTRSAAVKWEVGYLTLSAIDAAQTIDCLHRDACTEGNPIFGKHPSAAKLIGAKVGLGLLHFAAFNRLNKRNPRSALRIAQISCVLQGTVVGLNARLMF
jgi:hypothetical protein